MKVPPALLNAALFQAGWFACVLGGNTWSLVAAALLLPLHFLWFEHSARAWTFILLSAGLGLAMDLGWQHLGLLQFNGTLAGGIPPWLLVLWLFFASTLQHSLAWLQQRLWLAALLGASSGPLSYVAGLNLGAAVSSVPQWQVALAMAPAWMVLLPLLCFLSRPPETEPALP
jgi:hypothetical protein